MSSCPFPRNLNYLKLVYAIVIFFGISLIILQFYGIKEQKKSSSPKYRCDEQNSTILSRLTKAIDVELSETDCKELLQIVEKWNVQKEDLGKKPVSQRLSTERGSCKPHTNIFFLKIHKTASSTIMNILFRYGEFHNLTFAFPTQKYQYLYPEYFSAENVYGFSSRKQQKINIMCHHMRFSLSEVEKVMPSDTFYFTILRNPVSLMESSFAYNRKATHSLQSAESIEDFLNNTTTFYNIKDDDSAYAKNLMTFDLGFNHNGPTSLKHFKLLYHGVDTMFDLVLIAEYFDESLVLLKDALCWTFDDVLSFPLNIRSNASRHVLSVKTQERIKIWNQLDWQLYVYFNNSFWNHVERFGRERMKNEVEELRKRRAQLSERCLDDQVEPDQLKDKSMVPYQPYSITILGYNLKPGLDKHDQLLCHRLVIPEIPYNDLLWDKQIGKDNVTT